MLTPFDVFFLKGKVTTVYEKLEDIQTRGILTKEGHIVPLDTGTHSWALKTLIANSDLAQINGETLKSKSAKFQLKKIVFNSLRALKPRETGDRRGETGDGRWETGDERPERGDGGRETRDQTPERGDIISKKCCAYNLVGEFVNIN